MINPILIAGDTWSWSESVPLYPASSSYVLHYALLKSGTRIVLDSTADGDNHSFTIAAATTAGYTAGSYSWTAYVTKGTERYTVGNGNLEIKPNLTAQSSGFDGRSQARIILEALQSAYQTYISNGSGHIAEYQISGRVMKFRNAGEIITQINYWKGEVKAEERREAIANGQSPANRLLVRF